ncbi:hypothetical protein [Pedobacter zeae]|uniref:Uncharacterized protein n=1 Tax=Pedobacter zeae TaxID=1737356 RepID=A0A7W6KAR4_9SPHI|nr:hypothetical protein [Pedobacter zeae]MBB4108330.1 hypothetical protein [Pedobacter zeae]GGG93499.1 hypothetical protein GCM10007422_03430 [Pedobacter zeae]
MNEQDFKDLLGREEINNSGIADKMFPDNKYARTTLSAKLAGRKSGNGLARLTEDDLKKGWKVLKDLADDIYSRAPEKKKSEE